MIWAIVYTKKAFRDLDGFDSAVKDRIIKKLEFFAEQNDTLGFAEPVVEFLPATHRFRIGDYRALISVRFTEDRRMIIYRIQHRKDVYR